MNNPGDGEVRALTSDIMRIVKATPGVSANLIYYRLAWPRQIDLEHFVRGIGKWPGLRRLPGLKQDGQYSSYYTEEVNKQAVADINPFELEETLYAIIRKRAGAGLLELCRQTRGDRELVFSLLQRHPDIDIRETGHDLTFWLKNDPLERRPMAGEPPSAFDDFVQTYRNDAVLAARNMEPVSLKRQSDYPDSKVRSKRPQVSEYVGSQLDRNVLPAGGYAQAQPFSNLPAGFAEDMLENLSIQPRAGRRRPTSPLSDDGPVKHNKA